MPNNATRLYHKHPDLQTVLDFLGRCVPDGAHMVMRHPDAHALETVKAVCAKSNIHPVNIFSSRGQGGASLREGRAQTGLMVEREDWLALAGNAMSLLTQELRLRLPAVNAALKLVPGNWEALALADNALAAWGTAEGMIALPRRTVFAYLGSRYPGSAQQRRKYAIVKDAEHAAALRTGDALGFVLEEGGTQQFACNRADWQREMASAKLLQNDHLSLMLKIGLHMLEAGVTNWLKDMHQVLLLAGEAPTLVKLQTLLETYEQHVASYGPGQNKFRSMLMENCLNEFRQWQTRYSPLDPDGASDTPPPKPMSATREWKWIAAGAAAAQDSPAPAEPVPGTPPAATSESTTTDPIVADGVIIPKGVTVARGAHVRVCAISPGSRLKPGTVLHGDVSVASHTRFDGPVTIMNDVRIGWGLIFGPGLILTEGASVSTFAVKCRLPHGTRIGGSLRIGSNSTVDNDVSFGAENWIGKHVHIGKNVRFGPCVQVDDGITIGANALIEGHARLIGNVPENARVTDSKPGSRKWEQKQATSAYAVKISGFAISKNENIRNRSPAQRASLASELDLGKAFQADSPVARSDTPTGAQRKRGGDILDGHTAKRVCTGLESRYQDVKYGGSPAAPESMADDGVQGMPTYLTQLTPASAFQFVQPAARHASVMTASTTPKTTTTTTTATAWLDLQRPGHGLGGIASTPTAPAPPPVVQGVDTRSTGGRQPAAVPAATRQHAPKSPLDRNAQRKAWESSTLSKENQNALERGMRQSIRVPTANPGVKPDERAPEPIARLFSPMFASKGPNL